jgi:putative flippase GtrA
VSLNGDGRRRGIGYVVVGGYNTLFGVAAFVALDLTAAPHVGHYVVLTVAQVIAVVHAHATQRSWVWRSREPYLHELARFSSVYVAFFLANLVLLYVAHSMLAAPVIPAQVVITLIVVLGTFLVHRGWTFGPARPVEDAPEKTRK